jgi:hypothetical protein
MRTNKQRVFIAGRKRGLSVENVRGILGDIGCHPTHKQARDAYDLDAYSVMCFMRDNGIKGVGLHRRSQKCGGDLSKEMLVKAMHYVELHAKYGTGQ